MGSVKAGLFITLDGVAESPEKWQFDNFDDEMMANMTTMIEAQHSLLLGRVTYQEWATYWPTSSDEPFARYINSVPKYVVSTTLDQVAWGENKNITLLNGKLGDEIAQLKQSLKDISVAGSPTLVRSLLQNGLLDELQLMVHPVVAGSGKRLFKDGDELKRLHLVAATTTSTGVAILTYRPRDADELEGNPAAWGE